MFKYVLLVSVFSLIFNVFHSDRILNNLKYKGEKTSLIIGDGNTIREHVTINTGTMQGGGITKVGNNNLIMIGAHIAHDCNVGNNIVMANNSAIAGHAILEDFVKAFTIGKKDIVDK